MYTRRDFGKLALAALPLAACSRREPEAAEVMIGVHGYSFRDRSLDEMIQGTAEAGLKYCELWAGHVEPRGLGREELRQWRLSVPMDAYRQVRKKFDAAGIELYAYTYPMRDDFSDEEIARGFEMAEALGVKALTTSSNLTAVPRIDRYASQARIPVGMHNHSRIRENEFATPDDFEEAMRGSSPYITVNLDVGHFAAAGFDAVEYLKKRHDRIVTLHMKDRLKDQGPVVPCGQGDAPLGEVLRLLRDNNYRIPAMIEYEYKGEDAVAEVRRSFEYYKQQLAV